MRFDPETHTLHVLGRTWQADPAGTYVRDDWFGDHVAWSGSPDYGHRSRRCVVRFESGWSASIIWGSGTYSANYDAWHRGDPFTEEPPTVEVGVIDYTGTLRQRRKRDEDGLEWSDVETYVSDEDLVTLLDTLAVMPSEEDYGERPPTIEEVQELLQNYLDARGEAAP